MRLERGIGVMQGRLLPKYQGLYQAHPVGYWQKEFVLAKELKLSSIEFILDYKGWQENPLMHDLGILSIKDSIKETGVGVKSICADYFMKNCFHLSEGRLLEEAKFVLSKLISNAEKIDVECIVIPCVDSSSFDFDKKKMLRFLECLKEVLFIKKEKVNISLETDLPPREFAWLLEKAEVDLYVNYDIGNSASLGYKLEEELEAYGKKINNVHIKDRQLNAGSVILGEGAADFVKVFSLLKKNDYDGLYIMQAFRDEEGLNIFKRQLTWLENVINEI